MKKAVKWLLLIIPPLVFLWAWHHFSASSDLADWYAVHISRPVRDAAGAFCALFPFSLMELMYILLGLGLIIFLARTVYLAAKRKIRLGGIAERFCALLLAAAYIVTGFLAVFSVDYRAPGFVQRSGFHKEEMSAQALFSAAEFFAGRAMEYADRVPRDEDGLFCEAPSEYLSRSGAIYQELGRRFGLLAAESRTPKQMLFFSDIMTAMGFTGVYFPFLGESNVNVRCPAAFIPATAAHELAHQRGITSEEEANFLGVTAAVLSGDDTYAYSGYLSGALYLMNAVYGQSPEKWRQLRSTFRGGFLADWEYNSGFWPQKRSTVTEASEKAYDTYLKASGDGRGMLSYGACVDLIVSYYLQGGYDG